MVKKIKFTIDTDGEVALSVEGASGNSCEDLTRPFENLLGQVSGRTYKDSYFVTGTEHLDTQTEEQVKGN